MTSLNPTVSQDTHNSLQRRVSSHLAGVAGFMPALQIFTRWVNQKLAKRFLPPLQDVVLSLADEGVLVSLMEILSERPFPYKLGPSKFKVPACCPLHVLSGSTGTED